MLQGKERHLRLWTSQVLDWGYALGAAEAGMLKTMDGCIANLAGKTVAEQVMEGREQISRTADKRRMAEWVKSAVGKLDAAVDEKTRFRIMENCGRNCAEVNKTVIGRAKARRRKYRSVDQFLKAEQEKPAKGTKLVKEDRKEPSLSKKTASCIKSTRHTHSRGP